MKTVDQQRLRNGVPICFSDVNSYSSLTNRWKNSESLKKWWRSQGEQGQCVWYRKQQENGFGVARSFTQMEYEEQSSNRLQNMRHVADDMIPFSIYVRRNHHLGNEFGMGTYLSTSGIP